MRRNTHTGSQHFLRSPRIVEELLAKTDIKSTDIVYDIGAGSGVISSALAPLVREVVAIEVDPRTTHLLKRNIHDVHAFKNVKIIEEDFLTLPLPAYPYKIFSNIPFHISAPIVKRFFNSEHGPETAYLIVQKQFGQKLVSSEAKRFTSQLGMLIGAEYTVKIIRNLRRDDFKPQPAVDTVLIEMKRRKLPLIEKGRLKAYERFTEECFSDPKKLARQRLELIGLQPGDPPSRLTLSQWIILFNAASFAPNKKK